MITGVTHSFSGGFDIFCTEGFVYIFHHVNRWWVTTENITAPEGHTPAERREDVKAHRGAFSARGHRDLQDKKTLSYSTVSAADTQRVIRTVKTYLSSCCRVCLWRYPSHEQRTQWFHLHAAQQSFHTGETSQIKRYKLHIWRQKSHSGAKLKTVLTENFRLAVTLESSVASERSMASPLRGLILT